MLGLLLGPFMIAFLNIREFQIALRDLSLIQKPPASVIIPYHANIPLKMIRFESQGDAEKAKICAYQSPFSLNTFNPALTMRSLLFPFVLPRLLLVFSSRSLDLGFCSHHPMHPLFTSTLRPLQWLVTFSFVLSLYLVMVPSQFCIYFLMFSFSDLYHATPSTNPIDAISITQKLSFTKLRYLHCVYYVYL